MSDGSSAEHLQNSSEKAPAASSPDGSNPEAGAENVSPLKADSEKRIAELEAQLQEKESRYKYLYADFENFKKRAIKERSDLIKFGWESVARDLLEVVDNLERAVHHMPAGTDKSLADGLGMILTQFRGSMEKQGVQAIQTVKQPFDPNFHEAVGQEPSDQPSGTITQEHTKGYTLHGRLLRPSRVVISTGSN